MEDKSITAARWVSLVAAFVWGAVAEYKLALAVGADQYTAALLPVVLDVYGFAAMRAGRTAHVGGALVTMFGTQMVSHLLTLGHTGVVHVGLSILVSAIPPAVSLACHRLGAHAPADVTVDAEPVNPWKVETTTAREGFRADYVILDELHDWAAKPDAEPDPEPVPDPAESVQDDTADAGEGDDTDAALSKAELAAEGVRLRGELGTWAAAADALGVSRQWLTHCRRETGIGV